jgi:hypothetical protein
MGCLSAARVITPSGIEYLLLGGVLPETGVAGDARRLSR